MGYQPPPRMQANTGLQAPEPSWTDHLLTPSEQGRALRVLHAAGFRNATACASVYGLVHGAAGGDVRRQKLALELIESVLEDAA